MKCLTVCTSLLAGLVILATASGQESEKLPAFLVITVPPDAIVEVDGVRVKQTGPVRRVYSPFIEVGKKYQYTLRATFKENNKEMVREKVVIVEPGKEVSVDLSTPETSKTGDIAKKEIPKPTETKKPVEAPKTTPIPPAETKKPVEAPKVTSTPPAESKKSVEAPKVTSTPPAESKKSVEAPKVTSTPPAESKKSVEAPKVTSTPPAESKKSVEAPKVTSTPPAESKKPVEAPKTTPTPPSETKKETASPKAPPSPPAETKKVVEAPKIVPVLPMPRVVVAKKPPLASVPTSQAEADAMLKLAKITERDVVMDIGCGDASRVIKAAKDTKARKVIGIEFTEERVKVAKENVKKAGLADQVQIRLAEPAKLTDVSEASVVLISLYPEPSKLLVPVLKGTLKPGSRVVSHDFDLGDWKPDLEVPIVDEKKVEHKIYTWQLP